ncbi:hypothetical protein [Bartonella florencae]|uniref:hypothetical protein n=1 Tax=Bartonella florencae TaxID=928210 RepID=UPI00030EA71C|nr:hypothetical protein [Bartonella florencae]
MSKIVLIFISVVVGSGLEHDVCYGMMAWNKRKKPTAFLVLFYAFMRSIFWARSTLPMGLSNLRAPLPLLACPSSRNFFSVNRLVRYVNLLKATISVSVCRWAMVLAVGWPWMRVGAW